MGGVDSGGKRKRKREFAALSLDKFAAARQSLAHKQKEKQRKNNAKTVNEYKKLVGRLKREGKISEEEEGEAREVEESEVVADGDVDNLEKEDAVHGSRKTSVGDEVEAAEKKTRKRAKKDDDIFRLDESNRASREEKQKAKEDAEKKKREKKEASDKAARNRKKERSKFRRTNARGQPLMKFQIEKILERLEDERKK
ncbi:hypothetical protein BSKO_05698 [Bryopsis sp. KO-2023]|nr:hypothetical protein BSKO_05698 [Bryopsis sp. KO-2023]